MDTRGKREKPAKRGKLSTINLESSWEAHIKVSRERTSEYSFVKTIKFTSNRKSQTYSARQGAKFPRLSFPYADDKVTVLESEKRAWENSPEAQAIREALDPWKNNDAQARKNS
ncbi:hypothetical protein CFP56_035834 [Quercus suber]|uniref:Uncharacterized protein n=1 Tax=Quercus suber TaxID=58331 RepID=A0AAW0LQT6_QUESU